MPENFWVIFGKKSKYIIYLYLQPYLRDTYKQICHSTKTAEITKHSAGDLSCHMLFQVTHSWDCFANKLKFIHVCQLSSEIAKSLSTLFMPACVPGMLLKVLTMEALKAHSVSPLWRIKGTRLAVPWVTTFCRFVLGLKESICQGQIWAWQSAH